MDAHVVIATKNRALDVYRLLTSLSAQRRRPDSVTIVGTCEADIAGAREHPIASEVSVAALISPAAGLCIQRNLGLAQVTAPYREAPGERPFFVAFFDDDYRPANEWLEGCASIFFHERDVSAVTGWVLADGVHGSPIGDDEASDYLSGRKAPSEHWASGSEPRELESMYGCNMAFRDRVVLANRFDENLPLYGWQEDRDYTARAKAFGRTVYAPQCRGVHLGTKSGRVSGLRFGYSQIANPLYMWRKGTMQARHGMHFISRHLLSNLVRSLHPNPPNDYKGRLRGNALAMRDILRGSCHPTRILSLG